MRILDARETEAALHSYAALARSIREVVASKARGEAQAPPRVILPLGTPSGADAQGTLLVMPAADREAAITKLVTVHPDNAKLGLPTIQGEVITLRAETGERLGILDGATVTARRTAALSLLAAQTLAARPNGPLLIVGAGAQGRSHLEAFREGLGTEKVFVHSRSEESATVLAERARGLGMQAEVVAEVERALGQVSLIVTATTSAEPVLPQEIPDDAFVAAVGSFQPDKAELPAELIRSVSQVVVDDVDGAKEEAGDLILAEKAGAVDWDDVSSLETVLEDARPAGPVLFKSVGSALWDLAAARLAFAEEFESSSSSPKD